MLELELHLPLDYEQLPEFWQLRTELQSRSKELSPKQIDQSATFIFLRLLVTLGYLARSTNRPGWLTNGGAQQFKSTLDPIFGDDCDPVALLAAVKIIEPDAEGNGWHCPMFARLNPHLAGNYKPGHIIGNERSRLSAAMKNIPHEAAKQAMLLPPEIYKKRDGSPMNSTEIQRCIVLVRTLDRCLQAPSRKDNGFTEGLMASACELVEKHSNDDLKKFYFWLVNHRATPAMATSTEQLLPEFDKYFPLSQSDK